MRKNNSLLIFCFSVLIILLLGILVSVKVSNDSILLKFVAQQQEVLALQRSMNKQIKAGDIVIIQRMQNLENRLLRIEQIVDGISTKTKKSKIGTKQPANYLAEDFQKKYDIPLDKSPIRGNPAAKVTIIGFLDLQCPFSARYAPVINEVLAAYPEKVNYVVKHFPLAFHSQAKFLAKVLLTSGEQGKYWEMLDLIIKDNQNLTEEKINGFAKTINLDIKKFEADLKNKDGDWVKLINADYELGNKVDVRGTPTYYINGHKTKARDLDSFKKEINLILSQK